MNISDIAVKYEDFKKSFTKHSDIQITDNNHIVLDGCMRVIGYDENCIKLELPTVTATFVGMELCMNNFSTRGIVIKGRIHSITFASKEDL